MRVQLVETDLNEARAEVTKLKNIEKDNADLKIKFENLKSEHKLLKSYMRFKTASDNAKFRCVQMALDTSREAQQLQPKEYPAPSPFKRSYAMYKEQQAADSDSDVE